MADLEIPDEVIAAQRAYDQAHADVVAALQEVPSGLDIAEGRAVISEEQHAKVAAARAREWEAWVALKDLKWWTTVDPIKAEAAVRKAARG